MNSIYKYELKISSLQALALPKGAEVLAVKEAYERIFIWCLVDLDEPETEDRYFYVYGTGHSISDEALNDMFYLNTLVMPNGLVWHIYTESIK